MTFRRRDDAETRSSDHASAAGSNSASRGSALLGSRFVIAVGPMALDVHPHVHFPPCTGAGGMSRDLASSEIA